MTINGSGASASASAKSGQQSTVKQRCRIDRDNEYVLTAFGIVIAPQDGKASLS
jgi:hypothetical protein